MLHAVAAGTSPFYLYKSLLTCIIDLLDQYGINYDVKRIEDTVVYAAAVVLNPSYKWEYIERVWEHPKWAAKAKASVKAFWESKYLLL